MTEPLLHHREGAVLVLSNNNPAARNALTPGFTAALPAVLMALEPGIGAVVLTGVDGNFCSGGDLRALAGRQAQPPEARRAAIEQLHDLIRAIQACPRPVIAAVEGAAAGAGLSIALACDLLVAARDAFFSVAYVRVGLSPDGGATAFLAESLSRQLLTELCLTGDRIAAERLERLGVVNRLTDPGAALPEAIRLATTLAEGPPRAMARIKALCRRAAEGDVAAQMDREAAAMTDSLADAEAAEGISAFLGKRKPRFTP